MTSRARGKDGTLRNTSSFLVSGLVHGMVLGWIAFGALPQHEPAMSIYDQEIRPHEKLVVWYNVRDLLPNVTPSTTEKAQRVRAARRFEQTLIADRKDNQQPPLLVEVPEAKIPVKTPTALPNLVAVPPRAAPKPFVPPVPRPDRPAIMADAPVATPPRPQIPALAIVAPRPALRPFQPPAATATAQPAPLPEGPAAALATPAADRLDLPATRAPLKPFTAPPAGPRAGKETPLPDGPSVALAPPAEAAGVIAGLSPSKVPALPEVLAPRDAAFSAAPEPSPDGATSSRNEKALISVPGLYAQGVPHADQPTLVARGVPIPKPDLMAGIRRPPPPAAEREVVRPATRVSNAPDPSLAGRAVYSLAVQMPNITSASGSWIVWFAERAGEAAAGTMRAPVPLRKVDPKYIASAAAERVEGTVRLGAVIRRDGSIASVTLLRSLDSRLDATAMEALAKWQWEPALRDGVAVDVDAVFEIPFRLAPRLPR